MAFALITSLLNTMGFHFLQPLQCPILDDREMIESLCKKLRFLQAFLENSEKNNINRQARRVLETEIRYVALDAERKIESKVRNVYLCGNEDIERPLKAWSLYETLQQVMRDIESIERRIQIESNHNHSVQPQSRNTTENIKAGTFSERFSEPNNVMVGCDDELATIKHKLTSDSKKREVISIVGMGGIGKTTLVRRIYEDASIISRFDIRAWTTVSQEHNLEEMLLGLLGFIVPKMTVETKGDISRQESDEEDVSRPATNGRDISCLASELRKELMGKRYLIIIDDIWSTKAWDDIHTCFPEDFKGSRILLTTRLRQVADYASSGNNPHYMRFLNLYESWNLFHKKVFEEKKFPLEFETLARGIVEKCQGLPLTIVVVAGLLASINKSSLNQWGNITENLNSLLSMDPEEKCSKILSLSYDYLPPHLKVCFLYFGVFPESEILVKKVIRLWVAEGFLKPELNKTMEEVAEAYLQDLIDRSLVQIEKQSFDGKIKSCRLHDLLHSFCLREAQRESLLSVINDNNVQVVRVDKLQADKSRTMSTGLDPEACRWISNRLSHLHWPFARARYETHTSDEFRSILYFPKDSGCSYEPFPCFKPFPSFKPFSCFKLLRVLDIASTVVLNVIPSGIVDLVNLRYLALTTDAFLQDFHWFKLRSLQTFIVRLDYDSLKWSSEPDTLDIPRLSSIPDILDVRRLSSIPDILDVPRLRHVHFTRGSSLYLPKLVQGNLHTISWLKLPRCMLTKPDFKKIPNVKELGIYIEASPVLKHVLLPPGSLVGLANLHQLENLKIFVHGQTNRPRGDFQLPTAFPPNLKKLTLHHTYLPWEDMAIIGTLSNLEVLKLKWYAFYGPEWKTTENGFSRLKHLQIEGSDGLKHWSADADNFPVLEHLILSRCWNLEEVPACFADITTLQLIELALCKSSLSISAKQIQEERQSLGDDKLVVREFFTGSKRNIFLI